MLLRRKVVPLVLCLIWVSQVTTLRLYAQENASSTEVQEGSSGAPVRKFLAGAAIGFALHEAGHLAASWNRGGVPNKRGFSVTSAGFWAQNLVSEQMLTHDPHLSSEQAPVRKGMLAFNVLTSTGYAALAFGRTGPPGRDTLGIANTARISERWIGALVLAPAALDAIRYFRPEARWAKWLSRGVKIGTVALVIR
ncbi:MAG: hypothetical protein EXQ48_05030 [Acidobacteria bacterium]|nr:hypothetical protein [Acidobacteriota bacterium]